LVSIGNGSPVHAKLFKKEFKFPGILHSFKKLEFVWKLRYWIECIFLGKIYVDQELSLYKAFNCKRGLKYVVSLKSLSEVKNALLEGIFPFLLSLFYLLECCDLCSHNEFIRI
jgi:hypothetical protein